MIAQDRQRQTRPSVLLVDDCQNELKALTIGLKIEGFYVESALGGKAALAKLAENDFDFVLTDLMMPEVNGLQLARVVKERYPDVKTLIMSAYSMSPVQLVKAGIGAVGFVPKMCPLDDLVAFLLEKAETSPKESTSDEPLRESRPGMPLDLSSVMPAG
ncbi:MAG: response regulator [Deltaproteobacteria bacterium]|nr:response regulator [Deltaproteobacteria bacterium]